MVRTLALITLLLAQAFSSWATEPEWPRFRGTNGEGVVTDADIPASWQADDFIWKIDLPGVGHGSVAIAGERIFLLCGDPGTSERTVVAVSAKDGRILWQKSYQTAKFKGHRFNSPASTTPAVDNENVYLTWGTREQLTVTALTHAGEQVWQADLGPIKGGHGFGASPMVHGDLVVINNDQPGGGGQEDRAEAVGNSTQKCALELLGAGGGRGWNPRLHELAAWLHCSGPEKRRGPE